LPEIQQTANQVLPQAQILPQIDTEHIANNCATFPMLTANQKIVMLAIMDDFLSENIRTDRQIASDCGVHAKTVYNCKVNPSFNAALSQIMPELVKAKLPKYMSKIEKHGDKDWKAYQFLLQFAGLWTPTQRNMNINASIGTPGQRQGRSFDQVWDDMLIRAGELGWSEDRIRDKADTMVDRYRELRAEGAF
jgi:hypothetical protein